MFENNFGSDNFPDKNTFKFDCFHFMIIICFFFNVQIDYTVTRLIEGNQIHASKK
jgi:hypothetical protein